MAGVGLVILSGKWWTIGCLPLGSGARVGGREREEAGGKEGGRNRGREGEREEGRTEGEREREVVRSWQVELKGAADSPAML